MGMSICTLGMSAEFAEQGVAVNSLWPLTTVDTAAVRNVLGGDQMAAVSRTPDVLADAAYAIVNRPARECTGNFFIDEDVLREEGVTDFSVYGPDSGQKPLMDFFIPDETAARYADAVTNMFDAR
jgi:citronellol/citronellal dehydrogenase